MFQLSHPRNLTEAENFEEPMTVEEVERDNKEAIKAKWSDREREHFVSICKKFENRYKKINKIEHLKEKFLLSYHTSHVRKLFVVHRYLT